MTHPWPAHLFVAALHVRVAFLVYACFVLHRYQTVTKDWWEIGTDSALAAHPKAAPGIEAKL